MIGFREGRTIVTTNSLWSPHRLETGTAQRDKGRVRPASASYPCRLRTPAECVLDAASPPRNSQTLAAAAAVAAAPGGPGTVSEAGKQQQGGRALDELAAESRESEQEVRGEERRMAKTRTCLWRGSYCSLV